MKIISGKCCGSCQLAHHDGAKLQCRANPPTVTAIIGQDARGNPCLIGDVTLYPTVQANDGGCGHWRQKIVVAQDLKSVAMQGVA